jgi:hypothetical protein
LRIAQQGAVALSLHRADDLIDPLFHLAFAIAPALEDSRQQQFEFAIGRFDDSDPHPRSPIFDF